MAKLAKLAIDIIASALLIATLVFLVRVTEIGLTAEELIDKRLEIALWFGTAIAAVLTTFWIVVLRIVRFITRRNHPEVITFRFLDEERTAEKIQNLVEVLHMDGTDEDIAAVITVAINRMHDLHCGDRAS